MCNVDLESCEVWRETKRKARKEHVCSCCGGIIKSGDHYIEHFSTFEGYATNEKMCMPCLIIADDFKADHGQRCNPGGMPDLLSSCIAEREDDIYNEERDEYEMGATSKKWQRYLDEMEQRSKARVAN